MLNTEEFIKRLELILDHFSLSASSFADKINVQRSSISHLLSGRNKPSLDFVLKILAFFPDVNAYWLLEGSGSFLKNDSDENIQITNSNGTTPTFENDKLDLFKSSTPENIDTLQVEKSVASENIFESNEDKKKVHKIVFFYIDGTFAEYNPTLSK